MKMSQGKRLGLILFWVVEYLDSDVGIWQSFLRVPEISFDIIVVHAEAEVQNRWSGILVLMIFQSRCNVDKPCAEILFVYLLVGRHVSLGYR